MILDVLPDPKIFERIVSTPDELAAAWVGGPRPAPRPVVIAEYDPAWPALFAAERARLERLLGPAMLSLEHIGSTSVPGLAAKPIIDLDLVVADSGDEPAYRPQLEAGGYRLVVREPNWHQHRMFKGPDTDINLHVFSPGAAELTRHLAVRDWLRTHPQDRDRYAAAKRRLATKHSSDIQAYTDGKDGIIDVIYRRAFGVDLDG